MSRSGYSEDYDSNWDLIRWRGAVASAIRGKRGQAFLKEMLLALDALPQKRLIADDFEIRDDGEVCALGAVGRARGVDLSKLDPDDPDTVAHVFGLSGALACEIMYINDDNYLTPEARFERVRAWVARNIR